MQPGKKLFGDSYYRTTWLRKRHTGRLVLMYQRAAAVYAVARFRGYQGSWGPMAQSIINELRRRKVIS